MLKFRVVVPKPIKLQVDDELAVAFRAYVQFILADFAETTFGWKHRVDFHYSIETHTSKNVTMKIWTDDQIWNWVNFGTEAHEIWAGAYTGKSNVKVLTIFEQKPATVPGSLRSNPVAHGPLKALTPYVQHPGSTGRRFDVLIQLKHTQKLVEIAQNALAEAIKKA